MQYYIGVDGGGSKTAILAVAGDGSRLLRQELGSASWLEFGAKQVVDGIADAIGGMLAELGGIKEVGGIVFGMPCVGESVSGDKLLQEAAEMAFGTVPYILTNDVHVGWAGSLDLRAGVNVVAGTGSIAYGMDERGQAARSGGWDEFYSDEGSGYWIGRKSMELFSKQSDGRIPKSALYEIFLKEFGYSSDFEFIDHMRNEFIVNRKMVASLQRLTEQAALAGDESAAAIYSEAAAELAALAFAVCEKLERPTTGWKASYSGGVFKAGDLILPKFTRLLGERNIKVSKPLYTPVEGALLMAFQRFYPGGLERIRALLKEGSA